MMFPVKQLLAMENLRGALMTIPLHYYLDYCLFEACLSGIVRMGSERTEESGGYENEHMYETVAAKMDDAFYLVRAHLYIKTKGGEEFSITQKEAIPQAVYESYCDKYGGIRDTSQYHAVVA